MTTKDENGNRQMTLPYVVGVAVTALLGGGGAGVGAMKAASDGPSKKDIEDLGMKVEKLTREAGRTREEFTTMMERLNNAISRREDLEEDIDDLRKRVRRLEQKQ